MSYEMENVLKVDFIFVKVVNSRNNVMINPYVYGYMHAYKITLMTIDACYLRHNSFYSQVAVT